MNVTALHLERNNNNQHKYLGNINIGKYLGVIVGNEKSSHGDESNHYPSRYKEISAMWQKGSDGCNIMQSG